MAASKTDYLEDKVMDHIRGGAAFTQPAGLYMALFSVAPGEASGGTELAVANGYARKAITFGTASSGGQVSNTAAVNFAASGGAWSAIVAIGIMDAASAGNMLYYDDAVSGPTLADGETYDFNIGDIDLIEQ